MLTAKEFMGQYNVAEYTFLGLCNRGKPLFPVRSLAYVIGLVNGPEHGIAETKTARHIMTWLFGEEEQVRNGTELLSRQQDFFGRHFQGGYYPQTPVMLANGWSPVSAMLKWGFDPVDLNREPRIRALATGIWRPATLDHAKAIEECETDEELFRSVMSQVFQRAKDRTLFVSIVSAPGWSYETGPGSLPEWSAAEIAKADRILWKRTPAG